MSTKAEVKNVDFKLIAKFENGYISEQSETEDYNMFQ
jgi:hypothetical protein